MYDQNLHHCNGQSCRKIYKVERSVTTVGDCITGSSHTGTDNLIPVHPIISHIIPCTHQSITEPISYWILQQEIPYQVLHQYVPEQILYQHIQNDVLQLHQPLLCRSSTSPSAAAWWLTGILSGKHSPPNKHRNTNQLNIVHTRIRYHYQSCSLHSFMCDMKRSTKSILRQKRRQPHGVTAGRTDSCDIENEKTHEMGL